MSTQKMFKRNPELLHFWVGSWAALELEILSSCLSLLAWPFKGMWMAEWRRVAFHLG